MFTRVSEEKFSETISKVCLGIRETQAMAKHQGLAKLGSCYHHRSDWARQEEILEASRATGRRGSPQMLWPLL